MDAGRSNSGMSRRSRSLLIGAASLPFVLSLGFYLAGPTPHEPRAGSDRPALVFDQYLVDLQTVRPDPHVFANFRFHNRGTSPVTIVDVEPSCGCLKPEFKRNQRAYAPGETGEFYLAVKTTRETPGPKDYYVKLRYEDPQPREIDVSFRFVLPEHQVQVRPAALIFDQNNVSETRQEFRIIDNRPKPLRVRDVATDTNLVTARVGKAVEDEDGARETIIEVTVAAQVPSGRHRAAVSVLTDDPKYTQLEIPLLIRGLEVRPEMAGSGDVQVEPELLELRPSLDRPADAEILLTDQRSKALRPTRVVSTSPAVTAQLGPEETDAAGRKCWRVAVTGIAVPGVPAGRYRSLVNIHTDDPARPELQVRVHLVVSQSTARPEGAVVPASGVREDRR